MLVGIDEVGRGAWAGPLLVVVAKNHQQLPSNVDDSKNLSPKLRQEIFEQIVDLCDFGEGWVSSVEIDELGLSGAMFLGVKRALLELKIDNDAKIIMDGNINYCPTEFKNVVCQPKADSLYPLVSAASIYAKVTRDNSMRELSQRYPDYGFERHVGYGTRLHIEAIKTFGICDVHRKSFKPIKKVFANS